jgi:sec-independent protein translocase protein TatB
VFNLSGSEVIVILLLALVVLGPEKLPEAIRKVGKTYGELKRMSSGFQQEFRAAIDEPMREMRSTADIVRSTIEDAATPAPPAPDLSGPDHPMLRDQPDALAVPPDDAPREPDGPAPTT